MDMETYGIGNLFCQEGVHAGEAGSALRVAPFTHARQWRLLRINMFETSFKQRLLLFSVGRTARCLLNRKQKREQKTQK